MANIFSLKDYQDGLKNARYSPPSYLCPYFPVDPVLFHNQGKVDVRSRKLREALEEVQRRTGNDYFQKIYPLQARTLDYSSRAFPAYRFILPEVMTEDWLAIVDWGKFQRDHVLHQPLAGYAILKLLDETPGEAIILPDGSTLLDACVKRILNSKETTYIREFLLSCGMKEDDPILDSSSSIAQNVWRCFFKEAAYVAAVFHDLGYPWQYAERVQDNLDGMNTPAIRQNRNASQIVEQYSHRLIFHAINGYQAPDKACPSLWQEQVVTLVDTALSKTHGLPGALGFLHLNDCVRQYPSAQSAMHLLCVEWAATAIMMHDMCGKIYWGDSKGGVPERPYLRLSFDQDPLSAIVTLADVIEEFERPAVTYGSSKRGAKERVTLFYDKGCNSTELIINGNNLELRYEMENVKQLGIKKMSLNKDCHSYFDPQYGYLDMGSLGLEEVRLFAFEKTP